MQIAERVAQNKSLDDATKTEAKAFYASLADYAGMEQRIMETFREQVGREISVETSAGVEKVVVVNVQGDVVNVDKRILLGGGGEIRQPKSIKFADLTAIEKRRRLPQESSQAATLAIGLIALQAGDAASARVQFDKLKAPMGEALLAALSNRQAQQVEESARQVLNRILKATRIPIPETDNGLTSAPRPWRMALYSAGSP